MAEQIVRMRASPAVGVGGMYATGEGLDEAIRVAAMTPPVAERQIWKIEPVDFEANRVRVTLMDGADHVPWVWSFVGERPVPDAPLVLSTNAEKQITWFKEPIDNGVPNAYTLLADLHIIGAAWYAGTNQENQVVFEILPIGVPDDGKPYWVMTEAAPPQ